MCYIKNMRHRFLKTLSTKKYITNPSFDRIPVLESYQKRGLSLSKKANNLIRIVRPCRNPKFAFCINNVIKISITITIDDYIIYRPICIAVNAI